MTRIAQTVLAVCFCGCYSSSTTYHGDAESDPAVDMHVDPGVDTRTDPRTDTGHDPGSDPTTICPPPDPPPDGPEISWIIDGTILPFGGRRHDWCNVDSVTTGDDGTNHIELVCPSSGVTMRHSVDIDSRPSISIHFVEGERVELEQVSGGVDGGMWFAIRDDAGFILVAGVDAYAGRLYPEFDDRSWYGQVTIDPLYGVCESLSSECGVYERLGLLVRHGDTAEVVYDGTHAVVGDFMGVEVVVAEAYAYTEVWCHEDIFPYEWVSALLVWNREG